MLCNVQIYVGLCRFLDSLIHRKDTSKKKTEHNLDSYSEVSSLRGNLLKTFNTLSLALQNEIQITIVHTSMPTVCEPWTIKEVSGFDEKQGERLDLDLDPSKLSIISAVVGILSSQDIGSIHLTRLDLI